jgi:hypothetical protein
LYRIYAMFGDARLPAEYATASWDDDQAALSYLATSIDTLPANIADEIRPFLARPTDPLSVFHEDGGTALLPLADPNAGAGQVQPALGNPFNAADFVCDSGNWGHIDGGTLLNGPAWKVWAQCNDTAAITGAVTVAGYMDLLYTAEVTYMGPPLPDVGGGPDEAGDGPLDLYLVNQCVSRSGRCMGTIFSPNDQGAIAYAQATGPCIGTAGAEKCSGYIVFKRSFMGPNTPGTLAHELFHVLQFNHNTGGTHEGGVTNWFVEASAKWAEWHFYKPGRPVNVYGFFSWYQMSALSLTDVAGLNEYNSFTWPLFMNQQATEQSIATAWGAIEGKIGNKAVNDAISGQLPFAANFKEFAVRMWNEPLAPAPDPIKKHLWDLDGGLPRTPPAKPPKITAQQSLPANPKGTAPLKINERIPPLSMRYSDLVPDEGVQQITVDFSNLSPSSNLDIEALLWIEKTGWERRPPLPTGKTRFCLTDPKDDVQELIIVLANHSYDAFADITGSWTVESLEDPCSGWNVQISWTDVYNGVQDTITFDGVVDEVDEDYPDVAEGTIYMKGTGTASGRRAGWAGCNPGIDVTPNGTASATFQAIVGDDTITISAFADFGTVLSGISTAPFEVPVEGGSALLAAGRLVGDVCKHNSFGTMTATPYEPPPP